MFFDTSLIPDLATIDSAVLSLYVISKANTVGWTSAHAAIAITANTGTSVTAIASTDYQNVGATRLVTDIAYDDVTTSAYNNFTLNAAGLAYINKAGLTRLAARFAVDVDAGTPAFDANKLVEYDIQSAEAANKPRLVVQYHV